jgi:hypothetical protein
MKPNEFFNSPPTQGPVGRSPRGYFEDLPVLHQPTAASLQLIPHQGSQRLTRQQVRDLCRNTKLPALTAYACIMAWGGRDFANYRRSLAGGSAEVIRLVEALRASGAPRIEDFLSTQKAARSISGLGISFYTKLLFFLRPEPDSYILDQWTAKSAWVLFPEVGIRLSPAGLPDPETSCECYERFCARLEACCGPNGWGAPWTTGEEVERTIFDGPRGPWRSWLRARLGEELADFRRTAHAAPAKTIANGASSTLRAFAETLKEAYLKAFEGGISLLAGSGGFAPPNRLHIRVMHGFQFQFILNKNEVRAQLFLNRAVVSHYDGIAEKGSPKTVGPCHDFGDGITGNGPVKGATRQISRSAEVIGGWASPETEWPLICESAVEAMAELFQFLEADLPVT